jgi:hypothetical protein
MVVCSSFVPVAMILGPPGTTRCRRELRNSIYEMLVGVVALNRTAEKCELQPMSASTDREIDRQTDRQIDGQIGFVVVIRWLD